MDAIKRWFEDAMIAVANANKTPNGMLFDLGFDAAQAYISERKVPEYARQHKIPLEQARLEIYRKDDVICDFGYEAGIKKLKREGKYVSH